MYFFLNDWTFSLLYFLLYIRRISVCVLHTSVYLRIIILSIYINCTVSYYGALEALQNTLYLRSQLS